VDEAVDEIDPYGVWKCMDDAKKFEGPFERIPFENSMRLMDDTEF
jgi:hypothetical protein